MQTVKRLQRYKMKFSTKKIKEGEEIITTKLLNRHDVNSCCYYFVCNFDPSRNYIKTFEGEDCIYKMLKELKKVSK